jgi:plasmid stabilization system protein ParE
VTEPVYRAIISRWALDELAEAIAYIRQESVRNAAAVAQRVLERIEMLRRYPRAGEIDPSAPKDLGSVDARRSVVSGFVVRYAFPVQRAADREVVYVSIRRAERLPLDDTDYMLRFLQEAAGVYA